MIGVAGTPISGCKTFAVDADALIPVTLWVLFGAEPDCRAIGQAA